MERDSIISHGTSYFLKESVMERSDKFNVKIDTKSGLISYDDKGDKANVQIPYAMKLLTQELESMAIGARLIVDTPIKNEKIMDFLHENVRYNSDNKDVFNELDDDLIMKMKNNYSFNLSNISLLHLYIPLFCNRLLLLLSLF